MVDIVAILNQHLLSVMPAHGIFVDFMMTSIVIGQVNKEKCSRSGTKSSSKISRFTQKETQFREMLD